MAILFFDTETTGFAQEQLPVDHPDQPYIVQLACQLCEDNGGVLASMSLIINNEVPIPERAAAVHGITPEIAEAIKHFFGETLEGAHDALVDVVACRRVYFHLKGLANG